MDAASWKKNLEQQIRQNPEQLISKDVPALQQKLEEYKRTNRGASLGSALEITFASDQQIEAHFNGTISLTNGLCCLVCIKLPFGITICAYPHQGPCNMC